MEKFSPLGIFCIGIMLRFQIRPIGFTDDHISRAAEGYHTFAPVRFHPVVTVAEHDEIPPGSVQSRVPGRGYAPVGFVDYTDSPILLGETLTDCWGLIPGAIIHQQNLNISVGLRH